MIKNYNQYINETVYLFKTMFDDYKLIVNNFSDNGEFIVEIEGSEYKLGIQMYGNIKDKQFILREPSELSVMDDSKDIFEMIINDIVYILNKNQLGYKFVLSEIVDEKSIPHYDAIITVDKEMSISDLERIATTTKIINPKVKDTGDFDKMIYQTK